MRPNAIFSPSNFTFYIILFLPHRSGHQFVAQNVLKVDPERLAAHRHHVQRRRAPTPTPHLLRAATLHDVLRCRPIAKPRITDRALAVRHAVCRRCRVCHVLYAARLHDPGGAAPRACSRCTSLLTSWSDAHQQYPVQRGRTRLAGRHASSPAACRGANAADWRAENTVRNAAVSVIPPVTMRVELDAHDRVVHVECRPASRSRVGIVPAAHRPLPHDRPPHPL